MEGRCSSQAESITKCFLKPEAPAIATLSAFRHREQIREKRNWRLFYIRRRGMNLAIIFNGFNGAI